MLRSVLCLTILTITARAWALDATKALSSYSSKTWTQKDGLPHDSITAIVQTADGYLWLGTEEGLARFDGYDFTVFNKESGNLPSNSITALAAAPDQSLWVGTKNGLAHYTGRQFRTYYTGDGLPGNAIDDLFFDHAGTLWIVAGAALSRFDGKHIQVIATSKEITFTPRTVCEDHQHVLWVAGFNGLARFANGDFVSTIDAAALRGNRITRVIADDNDNLWMAGPLGIVQRSADGKIHRFDMRDGLPHVYVRSLKVDHNGVLWAGTNLGLARLMNGSFTIPTGVEGNRDLVWCIYEDRENNLWIGSVDGLRRIRDDVFKTYSKSEGLPGDDPTTIYQDHAGRVWVGFLYTGLMMFSPGGNHLFTTRDGLASNEILSIRETRDKSLLVGTRDGLARLGEKQFRNYHPPDELGRKMVYDALEDSAGKLWLAMPGGLGELQDEKIRIVVPGGELPTRWVVSLAEGKDGTIWAGTTGAGVWQVKNGDKRLFTTSDGLSSNLIRSLHHDHDDTLWIATMGGGLNAYRQGRFSQFTAKDGLLSDNVSNIVDDEESLWLGTTRGICRIAKRQLRDFSEHKIRVLKPINYGLEDGLKSSQCAPGLIARGSRTSEGRLWFPTSHGLAIIDPKAPRQPEATPLVKLVDVTVDGDKVDFSQAPRLGPSRERVQIRYTAIHLSAPERVEYYHKLEGLDADWVSAGHRREINYNSLPHGKYRFLVRAALPGGPVSEQDYAFEKLPRFYETAWFRVLFIATLIAGAWGVYQLRVRQLRYRFALVLEERARLAREIHDTLAQGFVGIWSQLEAAAPEVPEHLTTLRWYLDLARKMARHGITEARRSVLDLRASMLEGQSLAAALESGAQMWTAGSGVAVEVDVSGRECELPNEVEQHLLRIAQEAMSNALKHAAASKVSIKLHMEQSRLDLQIIDNGRGFEHQDVFSTMGGHFGLIGMRERAERLGGELKLTARPGEGTRVEVTVPL